MNSQSIPAAPVHVPPHLVRRFNFRSDPQMSVDPWLRLWALNQEPDIFYSLEQGGYWAVTRGPIIEEILATPELFSSGYNSIPKMDGDMRLIPPNLDPPEHTKYRKIITQRIFSIEVIDSMEQDARAILRELIGKVAAKGSCDFMADIARPYPIAVFLKLMGMPNERLSEFAHIIEVFFRGENVEDVGAARMAVFKFAQDWLNGDPDAENAHMLRELKAAEVDGRPLTGEELSNMVLTLFFAGLDTVSAQMAFFFRFLSIHPGHRDRLVVEPELIPNAVEELLRRFGIANLCREVRADTVFHGVAMKKGELVMVSSAMASVDTRTTPDALEVNFDRPHIKRHAAFGVGVHRCAGERLAKIELRVLLQEVLSRFPNLRLKPGIEVEFLPGTIMSLRSLPVMWDKPA